MDREAWLGCSPWDHKESDTTEGLHFHFSLSCIGEGSGNPLQCSCLENPRDGGAWWAATYGIAQSQTRLNWLSSSSCFSNSLSILLFDSWGRKESDMMEQLNWTELNVSKYIYLHILFNNTNNSPKVCILKKKNNLSWLLGSLQKTCPCHFPQVWNKYITKASTGPLLQKTL